MISVSFMINEAICRYESLEAKFGIFGYTEID